MGVKWNLKCFLPCGFLDLGLGVCSRLGLPDVGVIVSADWALARRYWHMLSVFPGNPRSRKAGREGSAAVALEPYETYYRPIQASLVLTSFYRLASRLYISQVQGGTCPIRLAGQKRALINPARICFQLCHPTARALCTEFDRHTTHSIASSFIPQIISITSIVYSRMIS